jgi:protein-S-isoprenylcysteine O-methyltransferase Ste14
MTIKPKIILALQGILMIFVVVAPFIDGRIAGFSLIPKGTIQVVGTLMGVVGLAFNFLAVRALATNFTIHAIPKQNGDFVQSGVFQYTRNPMYLGGLLMAFGWALSLRSTLTFIAATLLAVNLYRKILLEEKALKLKFGSTYESYLKSVKRLIPFLF